MAWFIFESNIAHFKGRLAQEADPKTIETLHKLLAEEEARLAEWQAKNPGANR